MSFEGIQVLRAIAALLVALHHALEASLSATAPPRSPDWFTTFGASGVDIFFVISGFIIFHVSFPADRPAALPASFLLKRITRIYPLYWCCTALVLGLWSLGLFRLLHPGVDILVRSFVLLPSAHLIVEVGWTLVYEMYFYLIFAATLKSRRPLVSLLGTTSAILILCALGHFAPDAALRAFLGNTIAVEFCFGLVLAYVFRQLPRLVHGARLLWMPGFTLLVIASAVVPHGSTGGLPSPARVLAWGVPAFLIVLSFLSLHPDCSRLRRLMVLLGDASYAIYLTHPLVVDTYARLLKGGLGNVAQWPAIPIVVVLSASVGLLFHIFVERRLIAGARGLVDLWSRPAGRMAARPRDSE